MTSRLEEFLTKVRDDVDEIGGLGTGNALRLCDIIEQMVEFAWLEHRHTDGPGCTFSGDCDFQEKIDKIAEHCLLVKAHQPRGPGP